MPWYQGPPLLYHLEHVHIASDRNLIDVRFPVQWVIRPPASSSERLSRLRRPGRGRDHAPGRRGRRAAGRSAHDGRGHRHLRGAGRGGVPADVGGAASERRHRRLPRQHDRAHAEPADRLQPLRVPAVLDVRAAAAARAGAIWSSTPRAPRWSARSTFATASTSRRLRRDASATTLGLNDLARVHMELSSPLVFDSYRRNRVTGSLIMIDEATNDTVARRRDPRHRGGGLCPARRPSTARRPSAARTCAGRGRA